MRSLALIVIAGGCGGAAPEPKPPATPPTPHAPFCEQVTAALRVRSLAEYVRTETAFVPDFCRNEGTVEEPVAHCIVPAEEAGPVNQLATCLSSFVSRPENKFLTVIEVDVPGQPKRDVTVDLWPGNEASAVTFKLVPLPAVAVTEPPKPPKPPPPPTPRPPDTPPDERIKKLIGTTWRGVSELEQRGEKIGQLHELTLRMADGDQVTGTLSGIRNIGGKSYKITYVVSGELVWNGKRLHLKTYNNTQRDEMPAKNKAGWCGYTFDLEIATQTEQLTQLKGTSTDFCGVASFEFMIVKKK